MVSILAGLTTWFAGQSYACPSNTKATLQVVSLTSLTQQFSKLAANSESPLLK